jgi:hypothetical protein
MKTKPKKKTAPAVVVSLRVPRDTLKQLRKIARRRNETLTAVILSYISDMPGMWA